jgi:hypothetical protein
MNKESRILEIRKSKNSNRIVNPFEYLTLSRLFDSNQLSGNFPSTLELVQTLEAM